MEPSNAKPARRRSGKKLAAPAELPTPGQAAAKAGGAAAKAGQTAAKAGGAAALTLAGIIRVAVVAANQRIKPVARLNQLVAYTKGHLPGRGKS